MTTPTVSPELTEFNWQPQPEAAALIEELLEGVLSKNPDAKNLASRMRTDTGTRFADWVDHIQVPRSEELRTRLSRVGFVRRAVPGAPDHHVHPGAIFPAIVLDSEPVTKVGIKVDAVLEFLTAWHITDEEPIEGEPLSSFRRATVWRHGDTELVAVERHADRGFQPEAVEPHEAVRRLKHAEAFRRRTRDWSSGAGAPDTDDVALDHLEQLINAAVQDLGADLACDLFFAAERSYWQSRNRAAQLQKARQDKLGLGWANHDHHTFRSSRRYFHRLVALLEKLGFHCRERFYAGEEAGWGAQVLENPVTGITVFADVDMAPEEVAGDFAHTPLPDRDALGTVGLWCGLHGESLLQAGMHHLECQFDHEALREQLHAAGVGTMEPFTNFPFLKQAFTDGERWPVAEHRLEALVDRAYLSGAQAHWFRMQGGAIGSHLENLERNDGYKGFNQQGVSDIIARTDARKEAEPHDHGLVGA